MEKELEYEFTGTFEQCVNYVMGFFKSGRFDSISITLLDDEREDVEYGVKHEWKKEGEE